MFNFCTWYNTRGTLACIFSLLYDYFKIFAFTKEVVIHSKSFILHKYAHT